MLETITGQAIDIINEKVTRFIVGFIDAHVLSIPYDIHDLSQKNQVDIVRFLRRNDIHLMVDTSIPPTNYEGLKWKEDGSVALVLDPIRMSGFIGVNYKGKKYKFSDYNEDSTKSSAV